MRRIRYLTPLPASFMLTSIVGLVIIAIFTASGRINADWGVSFGIVFAIMFVSSIVSITPEFPRK